MLIKSVSVQGFKTFANKTEFEFDPGITAIVGPNGSGKSNVVDAVRWCMGEQSYSLIRSKKTADVIFSGSDKKSRLSMAQVSLTLDNSLGELPIDFVEVEITRRAYRDGDNEYLINGKRVRLGDVTELLSHTGLGKRTYAVVGQGLIDKVLSLSPEERRSLFEEAAGITSYQTKRTKTIRQLEATQQNLTRVYDIIAELSPRLNYLRRQSERAKERQQIADDLQSMLRQWYGFRWHSTMQQLEDAQKTEKILLDTALKRQEQLETVGKGIELLRSQQTSLRESLAELHNESSGLHNRAEAVRRDLAVSQERLRQTQERREELQRELSPLRLEQETLTERLIEVASTLQQASHAFTERKQAADVVQNQVSQRQQEQQQLQRALDASRRQLTEMMNRRTDRQSRITQSQERRTVLLKEQEGQQGAQDASAKEVDEIALRLQAAEAEATQGDEKLEELRAEIAKLEESVGELQEHLKEAEQARSQAARELDQLQTRHEVLGRLRSEGAGYASGVRTVLQQDGKSGEALSGILGTVASLVKVPNDLDKAIETALGGAFQNVVTESWDDARAAIELLKRTGRGRATFLPLNRLNVLPKIAAPSAPGILGNASDLVDYDSRVEDVALSLLGRVWIAEDLPSARSALDQIRGGPRPTVVTVGGEIVRPGGAVSGGRDSNRRDDSILSREREYRELPGRIEAAERGVQQASKRCSDFNQEIEQGILLIRQSQEMVAAQTREERAQRQKVEEIRREHDRAQQAAQFNAQRQEATIRELEAIEGQRLKFTDELEEIRQRQEEMEKTLAQAEVDLEKAGVGELLTELADLRTAAAEAQGHLRSQQTLKVNQERNQQSIRDQIGAKEKRIVELAEEDETLQKRIAELSQTEEVLSKEIAEYQVKIEPSEQKLAGMEKEQQEQEEAERSLQATLRKDESTYNTAQLKLQRTEDTLTRLRYDIEQDFGLVQLEENNDELAYQPPLPLEAMVEQLPVVKEVPETLESEVKEMRARLSRVSNVNPEAPKEYEEAAERHQHLLTESEDLENAAKDLREIIDELDELMEGELRKTFDAVSKEFVHFFEMLFNGGTAKLVLTTPEDINNTGVEIIARPPGKRPQSLALLSGGERSLSACALIFGILRTSPTPFCVLDEVDAALDEANVDRFRKTVETLTDDTQFIIVTHNRRTLEGANAIYGITMGDDGVSRMISLKLEGDTIVQKDGADADAKDLKAVEEIVQM